MAWSSVAHEIQMDKRRYGRGSSQSHPDLQISWSRILVLMTIGAKKPKGSKTEATYWSTNHFVLAVDSMDGLKLNESSWQFHSRPSVRSIGSLSAYRSSDRRRSDLSRVANTAREEESHCAILKPPNFSKSEKFFTTSAASSSVSVESK